MPETKRTITDTLGYVVDIEIDGASIVISSNGAKKRIMLGKSDTEIFKAFIDRAINLPVAERPDETLSGGVILTLAVGDAPFIRCKQSRTAIDIHPASWLPLSCELALLLPRMAAAA